MEKLKRSFSSGKKLIITKEVYTELKKLSSEKLISSDYCLGNLMGINLSKDYNGILNKNIIYVIAILSLYFKEYKEAMKYIKKYYSIFGSRKRQGKIEIIVFEAIVSSIKKEKLIEYLKMVITENESKDVFNLVEYLYKVDMGILDIPLCSICEECELSHTCSYEEWKRINELIQIQTDNYEKMYLYEDKFYSNLL